MWHTNKQKLLIFRHLLTRGHNWPSTEWGSAHFSSLTYTGSQLTFNRMRKCSFFVTYLHGVTTDLLDVSIVRLVSWRTVFKSHMFFSAHDSGRSRSCRSVKVGWREDFRWPWWQVCPQSHRHFPSFPSKQARLRTTGPTPKIFELHEDHIPVHLQLIPKIYKSTIPVICWAS